MLPGRVSARGAPGFGVRERAALAAPRGAKREPGRRGDRGGGGGTAGRRTWRWVDRVREGNRPDRRRARGSRGERRRAGPAGTGGRRVDPCQREPARERRPRESRALGPGGARAA